SDLLPLLSGRLAHHAELLPKVLLHLVDPQRGQIITKQGTGDKRANRRPRGPKAEAASREVRLAMRNPAVFDGSPASTSTSTRFGRAEKRATGRGRGGGSA